MKYAHEKMIEKFESVGGTIVFDPNVRLPLWEDKLECQRTISSYLKLILLKYLMKNYYLLLVRRMKMKQFNLYLEVKLM